MTVRPLPLLAALSLMGVLALTYGCGSSGAGGGGDGGDAAICGCTAATAQDLTAQTTVTVNFGDALGENYVPKCILIAPGTAVSFEGSFATHPLAPTVGTGNPITATSSSTTAAFTFDQPGAFGYECTVHAGMCGAIYVQ